MREAVCMCSYIYYRVPRPHSTSKVRTFLESDHYDMWMRPISVRNWEGPSHLPVFLSVRSPSTGVFDIFESNMLVKIEKQ